MPRPKVRPEDRQRSSKACLPCQASKIRCDSQSPCMSCARRDRAAACTYTETNNRRRPHRRLRDRPVRFASLENPEGVAVPPAPARPPSPVTNNVNRNDDGQAKPLLASGSPSSSMVESPECTESRALLSSKGERVYIGETSALSFLQFLRGVMKQYMGPSSFTENGRLNIMLEADENEDRTGTLEESIDDKRELIQAYFEASSGFLDLFEKSDIYKVLQTENSPHKKKLTKEDLAILYLVIAIGGQCRGANPADHQYAVNYFSKGQQLGFDGMLKDPSIHMVRIFVLMAFYMLGACHRNAAYMYLGVASKAAATLGLHIKRQYQGLSEEEFYIRWRVFRSLRVFDLVVSTPLGRPISSLPLDHEGSLFQDHVHADSEAVSVAFAGSKLLDEIVQKLKIMNNNLDSETAEHFLYRLRQWISSLPHEFRHLAADHDAISLIREKAIGSVHVSCIYYFAIILTTRSFLISHLMARLKELSILAPASVDSPSAQVNTNIKIPRLANVCTQAGAYMANMCEKAMLSGLLLRNMCIVKAWVFAAGLILGSSLFVYDDTETSGETESAFQSARHVLRNLANLSPQAKHYDEILTSFAEAIVKHRQHVVLERQKAAKQYIDCIFDIDITPAMPRGERCEIDGGGGEDIEYFYPVLDESIGTAFGGLDDMPGVESGNLDNASVDLDGFSGFSFQDGGNWSIDHEPFGLLFDGM
ncbi:Thiamine repressible genes regulatory protein thi1 [Talaromyces islandicus]|uniref:Thiamine repressible genes regulatory protein thi1 n=1 Tax=Talaromyces islandicus TaxID=28573 RepID=A0A0U1M895_TALIS|nr:Thiamine repressible genes regulatory protein thi1 [Talaromyces islandicus]